MISSRQSIRFPRRRFLLAIVVIVALMWCGLLARSVLAVKAGLDRLQADLDAAGRNEFDLESIGNQVSTLRDEVLSLRTLGAPLLAVAPAFGWLPGIGYDVASAPGLIDAAVDLLDAAELIVDNAAGLLPAPNDVTSPMPDQPSAPERWVSQLQDLPVRLSPAREAVDRAAHKLNAIDLRRLSPGVGRQVERLSSALALAQTAFDLLDVAPAVLGLDRPVTYIVLLQNEDELRPTGGFISAVARVTLAGGEIVDLDVRDSYQVDDYAHKPYDAPPPPLVEFMGSELWLFRDANWSPDFPTAARKAAELYTYGLDVPVDGVIGLNQQAVRDILAALGPIEVEAGQPPVAASSVIDYMRASWAPAPNTVDFNAWLAGRKDFVGKLMAAILNRLKASPDQIDWIALGRAVLRTLAARDALIWVEEPAASAVLAGQNWDGAVRQAPGDYWMLVDANLGFNKANALVDPSIAYTVTLKSDGAAEADISVHYRHAAPAADGCVHYVRYSLELTYETLMQQCYYNYVRLLVPPGAQLERASSHPIPASYVVMRRAVDGSTDVGAESGKTVFATYFVLERGRAVDLNWSYHVPGVANWTARGGQYELTIQKQPGARSRPTRVTLRWPDGYVLSSTNAPLVGGDSRSASFALDLSVDQNLSLSWSRE